MNRALVAMIAILMLSSFGWVLWLRAPVSPEITAALAEQERARAQAMFAEAKRADADARRAEAVASIALIDAEAERMAINQKFSMKAMVYLAGGAAALVVSIGGALALVAWLNMRARVVYPNSAGQYPIIIERGAHGALRIADLSRGMGPLMIIDANGKATMPLPASEASALQLATQAQAAATMLGIARKQGSEPMIDVADTMNRAAQGIPAPVFNHQPGDGPRFVYVRDGSSKSARHMSDLTEFVRQGFTTGLARSQWVGQRFANTGNRCTRTYYDQLCAELERAGCIGKGANKEWAALVEADEALDAFQLSDESA